MIEIKKGVPIPKKNSLVDLDAYPFKDLELGDMFLVEFTPGLNPKTTQYNLQANIRAYKRRNKGVKFETRVGVNGIGVWRIK